MTEFEVVQIEYKYLNLKRLLLQQSVTCLKVYFKFFYNFR